MRLVALGCLAATFTACRLPHQQPVTPQRPTVSFDTSTTARHTFELETGVNVDPNDAFDSPSTLKYGTSDNSELFVGYSPWQVVHQPGNDLEGPSDLTLGARHRLWDGDEGTPSGAVVVSTKLPTSSAADGLSTGETDLRIGGILNQQFGTINLNAFYRYGALGDPAGFGTISEHTATLTAGWAFDDEFGGFVELAGIFVPSADIDSVFTIIGATYKVQPWLVLDSGVTIGLSDDAPDLQLFCGFTHNFGGPFANRR